MTPTNFSQKIFDFERQNRSKLTIKMVKFRNVWYNLFMITKFRDTTLRDTTKFRERHL